MATRHREEVLNVLLAQNLYQYGVQADPETIHSKHKELPDVIFSFRGLRCVIEGKYADVSGARTVVQGQAMSRIDTGLAQIGIAVIYPKELRGRPFANLRADLADAELEFAIMSEAAKPTWQSGKLGTLLEVLRHAQKLIARDDTVQEIASELSSRLDGVAALFMTHPAVCDRLSETLGVGRPGKEDAGVKAKRQETAAKIAALTIANAFIFQELLSLSDERVNTVRKTLGAKGMISGCLGHWKWICEHINYVPIFQVAHQLLENVPSAAAAEGAVRTLGEQALTICENKAALRHDLMGRIHHWLLHEAKFLGTYYTSVPAGTLLLKLALEPSNWGKDFGNFKELSELRIADPACGTGTLLMAASQAITDNFIRARVSVGKQIKSSGLRTLHQTLMENILHGYDVLSSAIHLTASTLAILAPEISFRKMQLYTMPMGRTKGGVIRLGSLDFLAETHVPVQFTLDGEAEGAAEKITSGGSTASQAPLPMLDLCVMNPPFTRSVNSNLLFGSVPDSRGEMQKELKRLVSSGSVPASITAGLGSVFIAMSDRYLDAGSRLAAVIPAAICTGSAWAKTRQMIASKYHLETVVTSHEAGHWNFSENTDLSEVLFVARKLAKNEDRSDHKTKYVNLWRNPDTAGSSLSVAEAVIQTTEFPGLGSEKQPDHRVSAITIGAKKHGEIVAVPTSECADQWFGGAFAQTEVLRAAYHLREGRIALPGKKISSELPMTTLGELADFGPDGRDIHDGFEVSETPTAYPAIWGTDAERVTAISQAPNKWLSPRTEAAKGRKLRNIELLWPRAARLMLSTRLRLNTQKLFATIAPDPALSNIWCPTSLKGADSNHEKAMALWLNSTIGTLLVLLNRVPTQGSWVQFKKPNLSELSVLDVGSLDKSTQQKLSSLYDEIANQEFLAYAEMGDDPARISLDSKLSEILGLPDTSSIRRLLGQEPFVTTKSLWIEDVEDDEAMVSDQLVLFQV